MSRNVVMVTLDSVRADYCSSLRPQLETTPKIDELASNGLVFENAISPGPRTPSSMPEIWTGAFLPSVKDKLDRYEPRAERIQSTLTKHTTIAERFSERGYTTIGITANPWTIRETGFDAGFDEFIEISNRLDDPAPIDHPLIAQPWSFLKRWSSRHSYFSRWEGYYDDILSAVDAADEPYFLWVFLMDTHSPYLPVRSDRIESSVFDVYYGIYRKRRKYKEISNRTEGEPHSLTLGDIQRLQRAYRDSLRSVDRFVDELRTDLSDDQPVLLVHGDHGEAFDEHGTIGHEPQLYEENIRVPLVIGNIDETGIVSRPINLRKIPKLLLDCANDSLNRLDQYCNNHIVSRTEDESWTAVRSPNWKLIDADGDTELYNLRIDPDERDDQSMVHTSKVETYRCILDGFRSSFPTASLQGAENERAEPIKEQLRSLGYLN